MPSWMPPQRAGSIFSIRQMSYPLGGGRATAGRTEAIVGAWLKGKRHQFIVATKCAGQVGAQPWDQGTSRKHILDAIDASLRRLGTDYVDIYQLHRYDPDTPMDETLEALDTVVRQGKARYIGVSNWPAYRVARALGRGEVKNLARIDSVQPRYNLLFRALERDLLPLCEEEGDRGDTVQPDRRRIAQRKARWHRAATGRHALCPTQCRCPIPSTLLARAGIRDD